ncbi:MAG: hypothetical protein K2K38_06235 [Clostridia bacterium]|nr:hypothetical protein [Clostridia bacterium]
MKDLSAIIKVKKELVKEAFLRDTLIRLSLNEGTPLDILDSEFGEVTESEDEYLSVHADVEINYTCQIGNDRTEEYWDKETYYENGTKKYRDIKKTRTITDWSPFSGSNQSEEIVIVANKNTDILYNCKINEKAHPALRTSNTENWEVLGVGGENSNKNTFADISLDALRQAEILCKDECFARVRLPGDHQKDKDYHGTVKVKKITGYILPEYSLQYKYKDNTYRATSFAFGEVNSDYTAPTEHEKVEKLAKKKAKPFLWSGISAILLAVVFAICSGFVASGVFTALYILSFLGGIGLILTYIFIQSKFRNNIYKNRQQEKIKLLNAALEKRGLTPFSK